MTRLEPSPAPDTLITRPVTFSGKYLFVNLDAPDGALRVEVLDRGGRVIPEYAAARSIPVRGNSTRALVTWTATPDLATVAGETVRFRFTLTRGRLYSFWVSSSADGASRGYMAAGGPGFTGPSDTIGDRR